MWFMSSECIPYLVSVLYLVTKFVHKVNGVGTDRGWRGCLFVRRVTCECSPAEPTQATEEELKYVKILFVWKIIEKFIPQSPTIRKIQKGPLWQVRGAKKTHWDKTNIIQNRNYHFNDALYVLFQCVPCFPARRFCTTWLTSCIGPTACSQWKALEISYKWLKKLSFVLIGRDQVHNSTLANHKA